MPKYSDGFGYNLNSAGYPANTQVRESVIETVLDLEKIVAARAASNLTALVPGDILEAIRLPAQCLVLAVGMSVKAGDEADTGLTVAVGDDADDVGFIGAELVDDVASFCSVGGGGAYAAGKYYVAADSLDVLFGGEATITTGKIRVWAKVVDGAGFYEVSEIPSATP